jgi:hypothetical protein
MFIKQYLPFLFFFLIISLFSGCPFTSAIPLNSPEKAVIDDSLLGSWGNPTEDADSSEILHILRFNSHEYLILFLEEKETSIFRAFTKVIGKSNFLTITEIHPGAQKELSYIFARYQVHKNYLQIRLVEEKLFKDQEFDNPDHLSEFIDAHMDNDTLYGDSQTLVRVNNAKLIR